MFRAAASLVVLCAVVCVAHAGKVSVEASSSNGKAKILVNGEPVEPGQRDIDGSHVNYQTRSESGTKGSCSYSSVSVTSSGDEPTKIDVQQGSGCAADDSDFDIDFDDGDEAFHGGGGAWGFHDDDFPHRARRGHGHRHGHAHNRDVKDRRFFDIDGMMDELRRGSNGGNNVDDFVDDGGTRRESNSGTGKPGEKREVHIDGEGVRARARTAGNGPHKETVETTTRHTPGGGVHRSVSVSASSSGGAKESSSSETADK